jgi:hypothetical protein
MMHVLMKGSRIKLKLSLKKVEMYKLAWVKCTAAVGRSHSVNGSMIQYIKRNEGKTYGSIMDKASEQMQKNIRT